MPYRSQAEKTKLLLDFFTNEIPHHRELGLQIISAEEGLAVARVGYREDLVGNPETGFLHGGLVTVLLDATGGVAVFSRLPDPGLIATLDLRIDYLKPSPTGEAINARVQCYKITRNVAFTRGVAYCEDPDEPVASMSATYML